MVDPAPRSARSRSSIAHDITQWITILAALVGVCLGVEGAAAGMLRHRVFAIAVGAVLALPLVLRIALGARWRGWERRLGLAALGVVGALLLAEVAVRFLDVRALRPQVVLPDPVLGHRMSPATGDLDERGFRNPAALGRAAVVCIGDSQTYGASVGRAASYPVALQRRTGKTVYAMALGGYGPVQYVELTRRALVELEPDVVVIGLFLGNDLADAHRFAGLEHWSDLRASAMEYPAPSPSGTRPDGGPEPNLAMATLAFATRTSRVIRWLHRLAADRLKQTRFLAETYWREDGAPRHEDGAIATLFTPRYRFEAVDLERPWIADGLRITLWCLGEIRRACEARGVRAQLLILRTKESCYRELLHRRGSAVPAALEQLAAAERQVASRITAHAATIGLRILDPTADIVAELAADRPLWPHNSDGHYDAAGCELLARVVGRELPR